MYTRILNFLLSFALSYRNDLGMAGDWFQNGGFQNFLLPRFYDFLFEICVCKLV